MNLCSVALESLKIQFHKPFPHNYRYCIQLFPHPFVDKWIKHNIGFSRLIPLLLKKIKKLSTFCSL